MFWQSSHEIETRVDHPGSSLIRRKVIELAFPEDVNGSVERIQFASLADLDDASGLPGPYGGKGRAPVPAEVVLFLANPLAIRILEGVDDRGGPVWMKGRSVTRPHGPCQSTRILTLNVIACVDGIDDARHTPKVDAQNGIALAAREEGRDVVEPLPELVVWRSNNVVAELDGCVRIQAIKDQPGRCVCVFVAGLPLV